MSRVDEVESQPWPTVERDEAASGPPAAGVPPGAGIPYSLQKDGKVVKEGKLRTKFRTVSIFWPPFAAIYWPMGFNPDITYDLVNDKQE